MQQILKIILVQLSNKWSTMYIIYVIQKIVIPLYFRRKRQQSTVNV